MKRFSASTATIPDRSSLMTPVAEDTLARRISRPLLSILVGIAMVPLVSASASAVTIFDNFGIGDTYALPSFVPSHDPGDVLTPTGVTDREFAMAFTTGPDAVQIDSVTLALERCTIIAGCQVNSANNFAWSLFTDSAGSPGASIDGAELAGLLSTSPGTALSVSSVAQPILAANTTYWIAVSGGTGATTQIRWHTSLGPNLPGSTKADRTDMGVWTTGSTTGPQAAFRITGTVVPEPSSALLVGIGLARIVSRGRKRP